MVVGVMWTTPCQLQQLDVSTWGQFKVPTPIVSVLLHHCPQVTLDVINRFQDHVLRVCMRDLVRVLHDVLDRGFTSCKYVAVEAVLHHPVNVTRQVQVLSARTEVRF